MKLLIVDDEMWSRKLVRKLLPWTDYGIKSIFEAEEGQEAFDLIQKHQIDIMITDMRMPGSDGAVLLQKIHDEAIDIEIIVMSGYEDYKYLHSALKIKAIDYLLKPIVKQELQASIITAIDRIAKKDSYTYIEEILLREDLRNELNRYYELKNLLLKAILKSNNQEILQYINTLQEEFFTNKANPNFINYVMMDIKRNITEIEKENDFPVLLDSYSSLDKVKERALFIAGKLQEKDNKGKISILNVQKYIAKHLEENISLSDIADRYYVSKEHLSREFKKEVGVSVQNYITQKKIDYAKSLLRNHNMISISNIPVMCGYNDLHYFYRIFKRITGMTPVEYRKQHQNNPNNTSI